MEMARRALELRCNDADGNEVDLVTPAIKALRDRLAQPEPEPVAVKHMMDWVYQLKRFSNDGRYMNIASGLSAGACYELAVEIEQFIKTAPVHASDISQERVDEKAKNSHEDWCASLTQLLLSNPPQPAPCDCKPLEREWVGLTDEERWEVTSKKWWDWEDSFDIEGFARAIEAKLKEKNT
jgi:hypothetical protein